MGPVGDNEPTRPAACERRRGVYMCMYVTSLIHRPAARSRAIVHYHSEKYT